jgi:TPR repeat protein
MSTIKTDIELSKHFGNDIYDEYRTALDFIHLDARNSLLKFRLITEILCRRTLDKYNISTQEDNLHSQIDELFECQIIDHALKSRLHRVRKLCNKNVHATVPSSKSNNEESIKDLKASYTSRLREDAILARELTVRNMEEIFPILTKDKSHISVTMTNIPDNNWSKTLVDAATSACARTQLQAGKIYEAQANEMRTKDPYNFEHDFCYRYNGFKKLAATYYEMSFKISADVTTNEAKFLLNHVQNSFERALKNEQGTDKKENSDSDHINEIIKTNADPEALYLFWSVLHETGAFDGEWNTDYEWMLEASANLGHPEAQAEYASILFDSGQFDSALSMFEYAEKFGVDAAYRGLAGFYEDNRTGKRDIQKALNYLRMGAKLNGPECLCALGRLYHLGQLVEKSESKAVEYMLKAIQIGSFSAEEYYFNDILKVRKKQRERFENKASDQFNNIKALFSMGHEPPKNIGRNDPCYCGSGKKHKKCCLNKEYTQDKAIKEMATSLFPD